MTCPGHTPEGYEPCTRSPDHGGPCAHQLKTDLIMNVEELRVLAERYRRIAQDQEERANLLASGQVVTMGIARLVDEQCARAYQARDDARVELSDLKAQIEHEKHKAHLQKLRDEDSKAAMVEIEAEEKQRVTDDIARRQREACAQATYDAEGEWDSIREARMMVLATPLVTGGK